MHFFKRFGTRSRDLPSIVFDDGGEERVLFTLPPSRRKDLASVTAFALPKSGSVLLDHIMRDLCDHVGVTYISIMQVFFQAGLPVTQIPESTSRIFMPYGYCYGGFRQWPRTLDIPILSQSRPVLLVRDPRDMLVSHYFSMKDSHPEPGKTLKSVESKLGLRERARTLPIDEYVREISAVYRNYMLHYRENLCEKYDVRIYRYEDVIYEKEEWTADLADHFGWKVPRHKAAQIASRHDVIPANEQEAKHIRQVHPGNFMKKLQPGTIRHLDEFFREEMDFFGYESWKG